MSHEEKTRIIHLNAENFEKVISGGKPVLVDFWADWCMPCHMMAPIFEELAQKHGDKLVFAKVNVDENPEIAQNFGISAIPTFLLFVDGKPQDAAVGAVGRGRLEELVKKA